MCQYHDRNLFLKQFWCFMSLFCSLQRWSIEIWCLVGVGMFIIWASDYNNKIFAASLFIQILYELFCWLFKTLEIIVFLRSCWSWFYLNKRRWISFFLRLIDDNSTTVCLLNLDSKILSFIANNYFMYFLLCLFNY